jgi:hypothetical protein
MDDTFKVISIDELADLCGYFTSATDANNGYGCNHPEQENYEMLYKDKESAMPSLVHSHLNVIWKI